MARALPERPAHPAVTFSTVELGRGQPGGGVLVSCPPRSGASDRFTPPPRQVRGAHWPLSPPQKHEPIWTREAEAWTPPRLASRGEGELLSSRVCPISMQMRAVSPQNWSHRAQRCQTLRPRAPHRHCLSCSSRPGRAGGRLGPRPTLTRCHLVGPACPSTRAGYPVWKGAERPRGPGSTHPGRSPRPEAP